MERAYQHSTRLFCLLMIVLGAAMVISAIARGGGALSYGVVLGALFAGLGAARLYLARPRPQR